MAAKTGGAAETHALHSNDLLVDKQQRDGMSQTVGRDNGRTSIGTSAGDTGTTINIEKSNQTMAQLGVHLQLIGFGGDGTRAIGPRPAQGAERVQTPEELGKGIAGAVASGDYSKSNQALDAAVRDAYKHGGMRAVNELERKINEKTPGAFGVSFDRSDRGDLSVKHIRQLTEQEAEIYKLIGHPVDQKGVTTVVNGGREYASVPVTTLGHPHDLSLNDLKQNPEVPQGYSLKHEADRDVVTLPNGGTAVINEHGVHFYDKNGVPIPTRNENAYFSGSGQVAPDGTSVSGYMWNQFSGSGAIDFPNGDYIEISGGHAVAFHKR